MLPGFWSQTLCVAAELGSLDLVKTALAHITDLAPIHAALVWAIRKGHREVIEYLRPIINKPCVVLTMAAQAGDLELVKSSKSYHWHNALIAAAKGGKLKVIKYCENKLGRRKIDWEKASIQAIISNDTEVFKYCLSKISRNNSQYLAVLSNLSYVMIMSLEMLLTLDAICPIDWARLKTCVFWQTHHSSFLALK